MPIFNQPGSSGGGSLPDPITTPVTISNDGLAPSLTLSPTDTGAGTVAIDPGVDGSAIVIDVEMPQGSASSGFLALAINDLNGLTLMSLSGRGDTQFQTRAAGASFSVSNQNGQLLLTAINDLVSVGISGGNVGFFGTSPVAQPVVPLTVPTVQNVIDALVALGLVAQHD
jgi:hypothetical protein